MSARRTRHTNGAARLAARVAIIAAVVLGELSTPASAEVDMGGRWLSASGLLDLQLGYSNAEQSWLDRGPDKLRTDDDDSPLLLATAGAELRAALSLQSDLNLVVHHYGDPEQSTEVTEAYWRFRTLNRSAWRGDYRVGAFYPGISMENGGPLWTSPYTLSSSALNTWLAEELRIVGAEGKWTWMGDRYRQSPHQISVLAGVFCCNDTLGAMLSWRGWAVHDRQTGINGTLPLRDRPILNYRGHSNEFEPFREMDSDPGFYGGLEWSFDRRVSVQLLHYDNRTNDFLWEGAQYSWRTRFSHAAVQFSPGDGWELLGQYLTGNTRMRGDVVDNDFDAAYVMAVKSWGNHRVAARFEWFGVDDLDERPFDLNEEQGDSQTLAYSYLFAPWKVSLEATRVNSSNAGELHAGNDTDRTSRRIAASLRYYF